MKINVGHREYGYRDLNCNINVNEVLQEIIDNQDMQINNSCNDRKFDAIGKVSAAGAGFTAFLTMVPHQAMAAGINLTPIERVANEGYWTITKIGVLLATPFLAWGILSLITSGGNPAGRTKAKVVGLGVGGGILGLAATPWAVNSAWSYLQTAFH